MISLVSKHFGLSARYINEDMPVLPDWYCCIAVALDLEADEWYNTQYLAYISGGGDPKKFPRRRTRPSTEPAVSARDTQSIIMNALNIGGKSLVPSLRGTVEDYAQIKALQKVYQTPDGAFVDGDGNPVEPPTGSVFVRSG